MVSFGSNESSGQSAQSSVQGFRDLPEEIQKSFKDLASQAGGYLPGNNADTTGMFTPMAQTEGETKAYNAINQGFSPTQESLKSDIAMQQNPYDKYVIDEINRQSQGQNSVLQQNMNNAGQFGSNRMMLGANDIDLSRMNQIGQFKQSQYNTNLNNALTTLPQARASDATAQLSAANSQRGLASQTAQAPINALASISSILGVLPTNSGQSTGNSSNSSFGFNGGLFSSDERLKENIHKVREENGFNIYEFNYIGGKNKYEGVIAQEVEKTRPDAVKEIDGFKAVDYESIGIEFKEVV